MKIGSISNVDTISRLMSIAGTNDFQKSKITIPSHGYKIKNAKLILRFNKFLSTFYKTDSGSDDTKALASGDEISTNKKIYTGFEVINKIVFHKEISEETCKDVNELLSELNKYKDEIISNNRHILNNENVDEFIEMLRQLRDSDLYFGFKTTHIKGLPGGVIDFRA